MVHGGYVYGWVDGRRSDFFMFDTSKGSMVRFSSWKDLDAEAKRRGAPPFVMRDSYTFWDIVTGYKRIANGAASH